MVNRSSLIFLFILSASLAAQNPIRFEDYFEETAMRVDYFHGMDTASDVIIPDAVMQESFYAGSRKKLVHDMNLGHCRFSVLDSVSRQVIYSESYSDLFEEWQSSEEAKSGIKKVFHESARFPFPKHTVLFKLEMRNRAGQFVEFYKAFINPDAVTVHHEKGTSAFTSGDLLISGSAESKIDIVFLAEGYTKNELGKFKTDAKKMVDYLLDAEPFHSYANRFNFRYVASVSEESGTDEPDKGIYKNTLLGSSFNTFGIARYCTIFDNKTLRNVAAEVPYDYVVVLVNSDRYGGSGFYNLYSMFCADMPFLRDVWVHEFGHHFAGLADEYEGGFTGDDYYKTEPWEPNITTFTERAKIKWNAFIKKDTPIPTPKDEKYADAVGLFEGGGYASKGLYRAQLHCLMRELKVKTFCAACREQVIRIIQNYSE